MWHRSLLAWVQNGRAAALLSFHGMTRTPYGTMIAVPWTVLGRPQDRFRPAALVRPLPTEQMLPAARTVLLLMLLASSSIALLAQRASPFRLLGTLDIGASLARMDSTSGDAFTTWPGATLGLELGGAYTFQQHWGLSLSAAMMLNGYNYGQGNTEYDVYHLGPRTDVRAWYLVPLDAQLGTSLRIAMGYGIAYRSEDELIAVEPGFTAVTRGTDGRTRYIAPEVGITKTTGRHQFDLAVRYVRHLERSSNLSTTITTPTGGASYASATGDHLGLVLRFHYGFKRRALPPPPAPEIAYQERSTDTVITLTTKHERITLELWDNAEYDGDTISVLLNGVPVLIDFELTKRHHRLKLDLVHGANTLLVVAHNEGRVSPNTASAYVRAGNGRQQLLIKTGEKQNAVLVIRRE